MIATIWSLSDNKYIFAVSRFKFPIQKRFLAFLRKIRNFFSDLKNQDQVYTREGEYPEFLLLTLENKNRTNKQIKKGRPFRPEKPIPQP